MRILMLNYEFPPLGSGGGKQSMYLAREYAKKHDVYFLTAGFNDFGVSKKDGYTLHRVKTSRKRKGKCSSFEMLSFVYNAWKEIPKIVNRFKPDYAHVFFTLPTGLLVFHPKLKNIPYITSVRGSDIPGHNPDRFKLMYKLTKPVANQIWKKARKIVCNSQDLKEEVLAINPKLSIDVIMNGIDTSKFKPRLLRKASLKKDITLLYAGRLIPLKQIDLMIKSLISLNNYTLRVVGSGSHEEELKSLVKKLKLENKVKFVGEVDYDNIEEEYRKSDIYVHLSKIEGMSNTVLEAMSCGLPVISTNVGGVKYFVKGNGFVLNDTNKFVEKINEIDIVKMGLKSREIALGLDFEKMGKRYVELVGG